MSTARFIVAGTTYNLVVEGMTFAEARAVEKTSGVGFQELMENPQVRGQLDVLQALLWVSMKRQEPTMVFSDLDDVAIDSIDWTMDDEATEDSAGEGAGEQRDPFAETADDAEDAASSSSVASAT